VWEQTRPLENRRERNSTLRGSIRRHCERWSLLKRRFQAIYDPSSWTSWKAKRTVGATFASREDAMAGITFETNERRGDFALSTTFAHFCSSPRKCDCRRRDRGTFYVTSAEDCPRYHLHVYLFFDRKTIAVPISRQMNASTETLPTVPPSRAGHISKRFRLESKTNECVIRVQHALHYQLYQFHANE
jgi:hypothetical protein